MQTTVLLILLAITGSSLACDVSDALNKLIQEKIDASIEQLRGSGELCYLGMKYHLIPDAAITASSFYAPHYDPFQARLDNKLVPGVSSGSWSTKFNAVGEWLQVDFGTAKSVAGVISQGRPAAFQQWVRSYKVSCGTTVDNMMFVKDNGQDKVFAANNDRETRVYNPFPHVMSCRYIRIYPQQYNGHMSMRVEFVAGGCFNNPYLP